MYLLGLLYVPTGFAWILTILVLLFGYTFYKQTTFWRLGIKGPRPIPFFGNLGLVNKTGMFYLDPQLRKTYGTVVGTYFGNHPNLVISDPEMIKEICITQFSKFRNRSQIAKTPKHLRFAIDNARDTQWKFLRSVIQPTFGFGKIRTMQSIIDRCLDDLLSVVDAKIGEADSGIADMYSLFKALTMDVICSTTFGIEINSQTNPDDQFVKHFSKIILPGFSSPVLLLQLFFPDLRNLIGIDIHDRDAVIFVDALVNKVIKDRREHNAHYNDLLKLMMDTQKGEHVENAARTTFEQYKETGMTDEEILMNGMTFLAAGYDTTSILLAWMSFCLATNPEYQDKLVDEINMCIETANARPSYDQILQMEYLDMFMCETLRLYGPASRFNRETACDITIKGVTIPKGMDVHLSIQAVHRNPEYWPNPEVFDPERFSPENKSKIVPYSWIPFGTGPRNCVGMNLALVEVKMAIVYLLQRVRLSPSPKLNVPPAVDKGFLTKPLDGVWVTLERRENFQQI